MKLEQTIYNTIIASVDEVNSSDPIIENNTPAEVLYGQRMSEVLATFAPDADADVQIACRAQHIARFNHPRSAYPEGRVGYLQWRQELYAIHGAKTKELCLEAGASDGFAAQVEAIMVGKVKGESSESQTLEDVACLVFLQFYLGKFMGKHSEEKLLKIVQKTWAKMSGAAHDAAGAIPFTEAQQALLVKALA